MVLKSKWSLKITNPYTVFVRYDRNFSGIHASDTHTHDNSSLNNLVSILYNLVLVVHMVHKLYHMAQSSIRHQSRNDHQPMRILVCYRSYLHV